jgi:hypothetical protein
MGAHLAARTTVPYPVRRRSVALGRSRPFGTASAPVTIKKQVKKKKKGKKKMGAHQAACTTVPHPVRRCPSALGRSRPFGTASAPVRFKK